MANLSTLTDAQLDELISKKQSSGSSLSTLSDDELDKKITEKVLLSKDFVYGLPKLQETEQKISKRKDPIQTLKEELSFVPKSPVAFALKPTVTAMKTMAVPFKRAESALASAGLSIQRGDTDTKDFTDALMGKRQAELGDIIRTTGFGGKYNEPIASTTGLLASAGIARPGVAVKTAKGMATRPVGMVEDIGKEFQGLYNKNPLTRSIRKYKSLRKGSQFEGVRSDLTPLERVENLKSQSKIKYTEPLKQEEELLKQQLGKVSEREKVVLAKSKSDIEQSKLKLKEDVDSITSKMKEETTHLKDNIELASQKSALEGKGRFGQFKTENSTAYGKKLDDVIDLAEKEGTLPTKQVLQEIFDATDDELSGMFIDTGAPLTKYNALKDKYLGGFSSELNPEAQAIAKALGMKKGQMKSSGIDFSKIDVSQSQIKLPAPNAPINLKELLKDVRSVSKAMSAKGKGAERAFTDEDLVSIIFQKNVGKYMAETYPEFAKLQKAYSPIIEQMKAGSKIFKPGAPFDLGTAPRVLTKPDVAEKALIGKLEQGTKGFSKGLGEISQPVTRAQQKLTGVEKGYEIARKRIESLGATEQKELGEILKMKEEAYAMAKEKITAKSLVRQKEIRDNLNKRLQDLETGKFKGREAVQKLTARKKMTSNEKRVITGGGILTLADYLIRRIVARTVLK